MPASGLDRLVMTPNISRVAFQLFSKFIYRDNFLPPRQHHRPAGRRACCHGFCRPSTLIAVKPNSCLYRDSAKTHASPMRTATTHTANRCAQLMATSAPYTKLKPHNIMKKSILTIGLLIVYSTLLLCQAEKEITSSIKSITLYTQGAQIENEATVSLLQGQMVLKFTKTISLY